jgi:hypothetical protein
LFSTSTGWPIDSLMRWPTRRATMSVVPPAGKGTTTRIGLEGKDWAEAGLRHGRQADEGKEQRGRELHTSSGLIELV